MFTSLAQCAKVSFLFSLYREEWEEVLKKKNTEWVAVNSHVKACLQYVVYVIVLPSLSLPCRTCRGRTALSSWSGVIFDVYKMSVDVELHFGNDWNSTWKIMSIRDRKTEHQSIDKSIFLPELVGLHSYSLCLWRETMRGLWVYFMERTREEV